MYSLAGTKVSPILGIARPKSDCVYGEAEVVVVAAGGVIFTYELVDFVERILRHFVRLLYSSNVA